MSYMTKNFNPDIAIQDITDWIKHYFVKAGPTSPAVIGISGGKDSTVAAALLVKALGPGRVIGVLMPCGGQKDIYDSYEVCKTLGIHYYEVELGQTMEKLTEALPKDIFGHNNEVYYTNTPARLRMTTLYAIAGLIHGRVANTCNFSEDYVGYSTKWGDNTGDFALLENYTVTEIIAIGEALGLPTHLIYKTPNDGMSGKSDEEKLGISYITLDKYIMDNIVPDVDTLARISKYWTQSRHKVKHLPAAPNSFKRYRKNNSLNQAIEVDESFYF